MLCLGAVELGMIDKIMSLILTKMQLVGMTTNVEMFHEDNARNVGFSLLHF